ncbi:flotillin family protein [Flindersiella endophytica]
MPTSVAIVIAVVTAIVVLIVLFKLVWRVAEPNEALIISGLGARSHNRETADSLGFKIVTGKGTAVLPAFQTARRLRLDSRAAQLAVHCVTQQGIPVQVRGVAIYKVGDDFSSIANAARRFLEQQQTMDGAIHELFTGHLRSIIGNLTVEDLIVNRDRLASETRSSAADEMSKLGLVVDSLQVQEIDDETGYIINLGKPHAAKVASTARIAQAERNREATLKEQESEAANASAIRDTEIKKAEFKAQVQQAAVIAQQQVIEQETKNAELEAYRAEKRLEAEVRKPADAKAYEEVTLAEADRQARIARARADSETTRMKGEAEADATKMIGLAEAEAIQARARALSENQEAVIAQQLAENWPEIVEASSKALSNADNLIVLNGAQGIEELLAKTLTLGGTGLGLARQLLANLGENSTEKPQLPAPTENGATDDGAALKAVPTSPEQQPG